VKYKNHHLSRFSRKSNFIKTSLRGLLVVAGLLVLIGVVFTVWDEFLKSSI